MVWLSCRVIPTGFKPNDNPVTGFILVFKAYLKRHYRLGKMNANYGFFSYSITEALHLSDKQDAIITVLSNTNARRT